MSAFVPRPGTPAAAGFTMPPEWAPQAAVWLSWPLNQATWPDLLPTVQAWYGRLVAALAPAVEVRINAAPAAHAAIRRTLAAAGVPEERAVLYPHPTNDAWCRDHGPTFVTHRTTGEVAIVDWVFNAWGAKYEPWSADDEVPARIAEAQGRRRFRAPFVCEGGAIEVDGAGTVLVTESVLLNPNRNPDLGRADLEKGLREFLGVERVAWLESGLEGDDTDGHIDTIARFYRSDAVVAVVEEARPRDPNHRVLRANLERLQDLRTPTGGRYEIATLPLPEPVFRPGWRAERLPVTYANFLVANGIVLAPTYGEPRGDDRALGILRELFPRHRVVGLDCSDVIVEGGAIHCLTQQEPAGAAR